ncbi:unnamed protein product [Trypanosoma congolense IL3000]|uniref:WGS project CAEQ00000000 data, annotated contig 183 n=1 Tax=Trypanosoma congolense (strain IL3000) TaxID=1068625 RepID=F9W980_TRYCI|nr:unnamed protein product [Trypanosoma congolense IL3000]
MAMPDTRSTRWRASRIRNSAHLISLRFSCSSSMRSSKRMASACASHRPILARFTSSFRCRDARKAVKASILLTLPSSFWIMLVKASLSAFRSSLYLRRCSASRRRSFIFTKGRLEVSCCRGAHSPVWQTLVPENVRVLANVQWRTMRQSQAAVSSGSGWNMRFAGTCSRGVKGRANHKR